MAITPLVDWFAIPEDAIWCIGQHTAEQRRELERRARRGEFAKVRSSFQGISPLKTVFVPQPNATIQLPRKVNRFDYSRTPIFIQGDNFTITPARYAKNKYVISTKGVNGFKSRACRLAGAITNDAWVKRSKGYTASAAQAERFYKLYTAGWDACFMTRKLEAPRT